MVSFILCVFLHDVETKQGSVVESLTVQKLISENYVIHSHVLYQFLFYAAMTRRAHRGITPGRRATGFTSARTGTYRAVNVLLR